MRVNFFTKRQKLATVGKFQVLMVREVELQLQQRREFEQLFAQLRKLRRKMPPQLTQRHLMSGLIGRSNQVGHSLSLREVHLTVEIGTLGKFTRKSHTASVLNQQFQHLA